MAEWWYSWIMIEQRVLHNPDGTVSHRCPLCEGASHPATGCAYTPTFVVCWRCTLEFSEWVEAFTQGKGRRRGLAFYDHVNFSA